MRRTALIASAGLLPLAALASCTQQAPTPAPAATTATTAPVSAPAAPKPVQTADCPYLRNSTVADANGQRVYHVKVSAGDPPACFFYRADGRLQLSIWVYHGEPKAAQAIIDRAAPVATSDKATEPAGWTGGSQPTGSGAVYAVLKGGDAVVVRTNQDQTIKARELATDAISALHL
ncbi:MAG: DUF2020 domain-containing protein [Sciscionella sp.]